MRVHASYEQPVDLPGGEGMVQAPLLSGEWLSDPSLIDAAGVGHIPISISRWEDGTERLTYRWLIEGVLVTLTTKRYEVRTRHPHKPMFAVTDHKADSGEAKANWDMLAIVDVQAWEPPPKSAVWHQRRDGVGAAVERTAELHRDLSQRLAAVKDV